MGRLSARSAEEDRVEKEIKIGYIMKRNYTIAVDLGESAVRVAAAYRESRGQLQIAAFSSVPMSGMKGGRIENGDEVAGALRRAIASIEKSIKMKIGRVYCGVSGEFVYMVQHEEQIDIKDKNGRAREEDFQLLRGYMEEVRAPKGYTILDTRMHSSNVDSNRAYKPLLGNYGKRVGARYNFVVCENMALNRVETLFEEMDIEVKRHIASATVLGDGVIRPDELNIGVAIVDLGKGTTNVAIYYSGKLCYSISIPVGSDAINGDLESLNINSRDVEALKVTHGCALADVAELKVLTMSARNANSSSRVIKYNVALIIEARVKSLIKFVEREIRDAGFGGDIISKIILTGGGANLQAVDELFKSHTPYDVEVADCGITLSRTSYEKYGAPEYATMVGLLLRGTIIDNKELQRGEDMPCAFVPDVEGQEEVTAAVEPDFVMTLEGDCGSTVERPRPTTRKRPTSRPVDQPSLFGGDDEPTDDGADSGADKKEEKSGGLFDWFIKKAKKSDEENSAGFDD